MRRRLLPAVLAGSLLLGGAACGDDDERADDPGPITTGPTGVIPDQPPPWSAGPPSAGTVFGEDPAEVLVAGDSLVLFADVGTTAAEVAAATDHDATAIAISGATWMTYGRPGYQTGGRLVGEYAAEQEARLTVIALATNDSRLVTEESDAYPPALQAEVMAEAVDAVLETSECVVLVTTAGRDDVPSMNRAATDAVNSNIVALAEASDGAVRVADWEAHVAGHDGWLDDGDVHFTDEGYAAYRAFIADAAAAALDDGC